MLRLYLLGPLRTDGIDRPTVHGLVAGEKRVALLVYLLLAGRGEFVRRDTLLALLWPDADEAHARGALRSLVHHLRHTLDPAIIQTRADQELAVDLGRVWCDVLAFEATAAAGSWDEGSALYRGPMLEGFGLTGAPGFEEWLGAERDRLRTLARDFAWGAARRAGEGGNRDGEVAALRRLLLWAPYDEPATRALMAALDRSGDRAGALRTFEQFGTRLRTDLDATPSAETMALASTLRAPVHHMVPVSAALLPPSVPEAPAPTMPAAGPGRPRRLPVAFAAVALAGLFSLFALGSRVPPLPPLDPDAIAVLPFDTPENEAALGRVARALPARIATRLNRDAGPRTADPALVLRASTGRTAGGGGTRPDDAVRVARQVGAGRAIVGLVASTAPSGVTLEATLVDAATARTRARASVAGTSDSLNQLLDGLLVQLLARDAGALEDRLPYLVLAGLPAALWYLDGVRLQHSGRSPDAVAAFARALELDSTFATAALAASVAAGAGGRSWLNRGLLMAWPYRDRLTRSDRALLTAKLGPRYPEPSAQVEQLAAWETLLPEERGRQEDAEAVYNYGDQLFHYGALMGIPDAFERARVTFERAAELDTAGYSPLMHLAELAFLRRDTADLHSAVVRLLAGDFGDTVKQVARWMLAAAAEKGRWPAEVSPDLDMAPMFNLPIQAGVALDDAWRVARRWRAIANTPGGVADQLQLQGHLALLEGRRALAVTLLDSAMTIARSTPMLAEVADGLDRFALLSVMYWDADSASVAGPISRLAARARRSPPKDRDLRSRWAADQCALEEWRLWHGADATVDGTVRRLRGQGYAATVCVAELRAFAAVVRGTGDAGRQLDTLDALARTVPPGWNQWFRHANLLIARLYERQGRPREALGAVRRRGVYLLRFNEFLSTYLREEGRLALVVGDTVGAARAWRHYLGLRRSPDPMLVAERDAIRQRLAAIPPASGQP